MRRLIFIFLILTMGVCFTASAMAAQPKGWEQPHQQLAKLVIVAKGGNCTGEPTEGMKAAYKIAADRYNSLMKNLNETSTTPRPADLPDKAPSFDQARLVACWAGKAPRVSSSDRWTSGYLIYLALLRVAGKNCGGSPSNVDHVVYDGGANIYHIAHKAPGLPKDAPSFDEARRLACRR